MNSDFKPPEKHRPTVSAIEDSPDRPALKSEAAVDEQKIEQEFGPAPDEAKTRSGRLRLLLPAFASRRPRKKHLILAGLVILVLAAAATSFAILHFDHPTVIQPKLVVKKYVAPKPTTVASTLTGLQVDPSVNNRPVTAVMVENSTFARPQSGLDQAGVVFEALAEGGITRFMAVYQDTQPNYIGPVRSARPYYIQWALGFDAVYAHDGGSPEALSDITSWNVKDLNEFYNSSAFEAITSREAPHDVYTSIAQLSQVETKDNYGKSIYTGFPRKKDSPSKTPNATTINLTFSSTDYNVEYNYVATTNSYQRSEGGAPHMELNSDGSQVQITPKVVVAMVLPYSYGALDSSGAYYSVYGVVGSGQVDVFQDGTVTVGTWAKTSNASQITFTQANGQPLDLNAGQTWIEALAGSQDITYN